MKKKLLLLLLSIFALHCAVAQNKYDVNGDGIVNVSDISAIYDYIINGDPSVDPTPSGPVMYIHSDLGWSDYALYVWANNGNVKDPWPGVQPSSTTTINDEVWMVFNMDEIYYTTANTNWIINNNGGGRQYDLMQDFSFTQDTYVRVSDSGSYTISDKPGEPSVDPNPDPGTPTQVTIDNTTAVSTKNRVIYELNVGSFTSSGTLTAAKNQLSELRKLGVDIVWLMPIYPRGGGINSPYAATDFKAVNPNYGSINDLKSFVTRAHELGMEVWLDWVPNHTATNHRWVTEHPEYYTTQNGSIVHPNNYSDVYQLNYSNTATVNAMNDCLKFWIDQADIDGYRCDYISSSAIPASYWTNAIPLIKNYKSGKSFYFLGEGDIVHEATRLSNVGFDYDFAFNYQGSKLQRFGNGTSASTMKSNLQSFMSESTGKSFGRMVYLTNHDVNFNDGGNTLTSMYGDNRYSFSVLEFTFFGLPLLYNGQEIGSDQKLDYFNDTKVNWNNVDNKMKNTIRALVALHHTQPALADNVTDVTYHTTNNSSVLAYTKASGNNKVLVVINLGASAVNVQVSGVDAGNYTRWIDSSTIASGITATSTDLTSTSTISLEPKGYAVYAK